MASRSHRTGYNSRGRSGRRDNGPVRHGTGSPKKSANEVDESSPIIKAFRVYQKELDSRNDRHERLVKLSRDITIESKRIIFLLQRVTGSEDRRALLSEAAAKLKELHSSKFLPVAKELNGQDPYQFLRAISPGLQEYIEAVTFYNYLLHQELVGVETIQADLIFPSATADKLNKNQSDCQGVGDTVESDITPQDDSNSNTTSTGHCDSSCLMSDIDNQPNSTSSALTSSASSTNACLSNLCVLVPPIEYMLGVADFTGELMRMAINSVGAGDLETPKEVAEMMRVINNAFVLFNHVPRELRRKTSTLRQSLQKVENACYNLRVRGSEIPKHMLADVFSSAPTSINEADNFSIHETDEVNT